MKRSRTCVECGNWWFDGGSPTYSELTIGEEWSSFCEKKHWEVKKPTSIERKAYAKMLLTARNCADFELADYAEEANELRPSVA